MTEERLERLFICQCTQCQQQLQTASAQLHANIIEMVVRLNEKHRRQFAALMACHFGHGGTQMVAEITGLSRNTIARGKREIKEADFTTRVRASGGGRLRAEKKSRG